MWRGDGKAQSDDVVVQLRAPKCYGEKWRFDVLCLVEWSGFAPGLNGRMVWLNEFGNK